MKPKKVLIAGCGYVGSKLADVLAARGHSVSVIRRSEIKSTSSISSYQVDLCNVDSLSKLPTDIDICFYLVAAEAQTREAYNRAYLLALKNLLAYVNSQNANPVRWIFTSSTSVYHQQDGSWVDETSSTEPTDFTGQILLEAEEHLHVNAPSATVVRFSGIYGPGRMRLVEQVKNNNRPIIHSDVFSNRFHLEDCAGLLAFLGESTAAPQVVIGSDNEPTKLGEIYNWVSLQLGIKDQPRPACGDEPTSGLPSKLRSNKRCSNSLMRQLGYSPRFPSFREGFRSALV